MENSERGYPQVYRLRLIAVAYCAVIFAAFAIGIYGVFSLVSLAGAEIERNVHVISSLR